MQRFKDYWHSIGKFKKIALVLLTSVLLFSMAPQNMVRLAVLADGYPKIAVTCHPAYTQETHNQVREFFCPVYTIYPKRYQAWYLEELTVDFQVFRFFIFTFAFPKINDD